MTTQETYQQRISTITTSLAAEQRIRSRIAWSRLAVLLVATVAIIQIWPLSTGGAILVFIFALAAFLRLVVLSSRANTKIDQFKHLLIINQEELEALDHRYTHFADGHEFQPADHPYANDLDIFGRASIYQYINRTSSAQGNSLLASWLLKPTDADNILMRQTAAKELAPQFEWRQELQAFGRAGSLDPKSQDEIRTWMAEPAYFSKRKIWSILRYLLPAILFILLYLDITDVIPSPIFYAILFIYLIIGLLITRMVMRQYQQLDKLAGKLKGLVQSLTLIENLDVTSPQLSELKQMLVSGNQRASISIRRLQGLLGRFDVRLNPLLFLPINTFLLWDLQQAMYLEQWKTAEHHRIDDWITALSAFEVLSSIANLSFNHEPWAFPELANDHGSFQATGLGHPLLSSTKRVTSDFSTSGLPQIALVTGSNMAGKSTFLRSIGTNIILAMCGAPVCAERMTVSVMQVMSSMRIADNLEESASTFYAELKKLKGIIAAVNRHEKVFLLLDEILRGTNSLDRHAGSNALIRQLIKQRAAAVLATHDLELAVLANEFPQAITNYHFDVQVEGNELYFDYKLKNGVCTSMNASILMKQIGIEM